MSENNKPKQYSKNKRLWIIGLVILIFVVGVVGGWVYSFVKQNDQNSTSRPSLDSKRISLAKQTKDSAEKIIGTGGKVSGAGAVYDKAIKDAESTGDTILKEMFLLDEATLYFNDNEFDKALGYAIQAESITKNDNVEQFIAQIYEKKGDSQKAIIYYQSAIQLVDKSKPMAQENTDYYKSKIIELGGTSN